MHHSVHEDNFLAATYGLPMQLPVAELGFSTPPTTVLDLSLVSDLTGAPYDESSKRIDWKVEKTIYCPTVRVRVTSVAVYIARRTL